LTGYLSFIYVACCDDDTNCMSPDQYLMWNKKITKEILFLPHSSCRTKVYTGDYFT